VATDLHAAKDRQAILQTGRGRDVPQAEAVEKPHCSSTAIGRFVSFTVMLLWLTERPDLRKADVQRTISSDTACKIRYRLLQLVDTS
jgi:hypothetical protein